MTFEINIHSDVNGQSSVKHVFDYDKVTFEMDSSRGGKRSEVWERSANDNGWFEVKGMTGAAPFCRAMGELSFRYQ